jgi:hypothetical protein
VSKSELHGLFKLSGVASGDDALTLGARNAEHLRLKPFSPFSYSSYFEPPVLLWNAKLEKDFMLWSPRLKSLFAETYTFLIFKSSCYRYSRCCVSKNMDLGRKRTRQNW